MDSDSIDWEEKASLTKLDLANKHLTTLKGISKCKNLTWLNVSNNSLESLQWIKKLRKLNVLTASNNKISTCKHLGDLTDLKALILNNNNISCVQGIQGLNDLNTLVLSHNEIEDIDITELVSLSKLSLSHNKLTKVPDLKELSSLKELRLNDNQIEVIPETLQTCKRLKLIDMGNNKISNFEFLKVLGKTRVENLNLKGNPVCSNEKYQEKITDELNVLKILDGKRITGSFTFDKKIEEARNQEPTKEKSSPEKDNSSESVGNLKKSSQEITATNKEINIKDSNKPKEKAIKTRGFVSKFSVEVEKKDGVDRKRTKKQKKNEKIDKAKKINAKTFGATGRTGSNNEVDYSSAPKDGKVESRSGPKENKENDVRTENKQGEYLIARQSKNGGDVVTEKRLKSKNKRKRKIENIAETRNESGENISSVEIGNMNISEDLCSKPAKVRKKTKSEDEEIVIKEGLNLTVGDAEKNISKGKTLKKLKKKPKEGDHGIKGSTENRTQKKTKSKTKRNSSNSTTTIDSRSGVVSVQLTDKGKSRKKDTEKFLFVEQRGDHAFGTGSSNAW